MKLLPTILTVFAIAASLSLAVEPEKLVFKTEWKGERIELPPGFAPEMKLKGIEEIRFAPGMFDAKSASFFSYVFVFSVDGDQKFSEELIQEETLAYYRGLAKSVLGGKGKEVDVSTFKFELKKVDAAKQVPASVLDEKRVTQYSGKLDWVEPFVTAERQVLHFELQSWTDPKTKRSYLFVVTSPKTMGDEVAIWKELRKIRSEFSVSS